MLLLEQNITKKGQVNKNAIQLKFEANNNEKYKFKSIWNSAVYEKESKAGYLSELYHLALLEKLSWEKKYWETSFCHPIF